MSQHDEFDRSLGRWFEAEAPLAATADVLDRALSATRRRRPRPKLFAALGSHWVDAGSGPLSGVVTLGRTSVRTSMALLLLLVAIAVAAGAVLIALSPPEQAPAASQLVIYARTSRGGLDGTIKELAVNADGRVIWITDERVGLVEQRLTPEGVEWLRSKAISTGLFERSGGLRTAGADWGNMTVRRGDRLVTVIWSQAPLGVSDLGPEAEVVRATAEQIVELTELTAFLGEPTAWGLPDTMYVQSEITPFVPSQLWVSYDRSRPNFSKLPSPAREVVARILGRVLRHECANITIEQAREMAQVLAQAGVIAPDHDVRLGLAFTVPSSTSFVHIHPVLPHDVGTTCED